MLSIDSLLARAKTAGWICPKCGNGQGKDGTGITEDPNNPGHYKCFKCDFYGHVSERMMEEHANRQQAYIRSLGL